MDIKQMLIAEFKAKNINFDENYSLGGYIDDSFDGVLECIEVVSNQHAFNKLNDIREAVKLPFLLVTEEINTILKQQPTSTKGGGCYNPKFYKEDISKIS